MRPARKIAKQILSIYRRENEIPVEQMAIALKKEGLKPIVGHHPTSISLKFNKKDVVLRINPSAADSFSRYGWFVVESDIREEKEENELIRTIKRIFKSNGFKTDIYHGRLEIKPKPTDKLEKEDYATESVPFSSSLISKPRYQEKLLKDGAVQITFGSEFIESSYALAKDDKDLHELINRRSWKGMSLYDTPERNPQIWIKYDKKLKLFWMETGFFD